MTEISLEHNSIGTSLNVKGHIEEKVSRGLYFDDKFSVIFGCQMTPHISSSLSDEAAVLTEQASTLQPHIPFDRIGMYADLQGIFFAARRRYNQSTNLEDMKVIIKDTGYDLLLTDNLNFSIFLGS